MVVTGQGQFMAIDKDKLIGSCVQLPGHFDVDRMRAEIASIPAGLWGEYRSEEQREAVAVFLKGYPPNQFKPDEERTVLAKLPYLRQVIYEQLPGKPRKCLVARLPAAATIHVHVDGGKGMEEYFTSTVRLHIPIWTNPDVHFFIAPRFFALGEGELWAINNRVEHGVINDHLHDERVHLIVDVDPDEEMIEMIRAGWRPDGWDDEVRLRRLHASGELPSEVSSRLSAGDR